MSAALRALLSLCSCWLDPRAAWSLVGGTVPATCKLGVVAVNTSQVTVHTSGWGSSQTQIGVTLTAGDV